MFIFLWCWGGGKGGWRGRGARKDRGKGRKEGPGGCGVVGWGDDADERYMEYVERTACCTEY